MSSRVPDSKPVFGAMAGSARCLVTVVKAMLAVAPSSVQEQYDTLILRRSHELMDFTNYRALRMSLMMTLLATLDSLVWGLYNVWILVLFASLYLIWPGVELVAKFGKVVSFRLGFVYTARSQYRSVTGISCPPLALSAVCAMDPEFHVAYRPDWTRIHPLLVRRGSRLAPAAFDFDLAEFLLHLSALAYESNAVVADVITNWNDPALDLHYSRFGHEGLILVVLYSVPGQFAVASFKGTSPFDLNEWLTDCSLRKTAPKNSLLPGLVHSGFFDVFGFPKDENVAVFEPDPSFAGPVKWSDEAVRLEGLGSPGPVRPVRNSAIMPMIRIGVEAFLKQRRKPSGIRTESDGLWQTEESDGFWQHIEEEFRAIVTKFAVAGASKPSLIMTGHSLGGATASMFSSLLLWRRTRAPTSVMRLDWDACFRLEGCLTFGTPRAGDSCWSEAIEAVRTSVKFTPLDQPLFYSYRVINCNDFVATSPISPIIDFRWTANWSQPESNGFLSLLDCRHYGTPILLHCRSKQERFSASYSPRERCLSDYIQNYLGALMSFPGVLRGGNCIDVMTGFLKLFAVPTLAIDHGPTEYAANMGRLITSPCSSVKNMQ